MKSIVTLILLSLSLLSYAEQESCKEAISLQATDILGLELDLTFEETKEQFRGLDNLTFLYKKGEIERYKVIASSKIDKYKLNLNVNYVCDVTSYQLLDVNQCVKACQSFSDGVQDYKRCVKGCY